MSGTGITIQVTGVDKVLAALENAATKTERRIIQAVYGSAFRIQAEARRLAPVDTGRLRSSIYVRFMDGGRAAEIGTDVHYASYQESGTRFMPARPFIRPAYEAERTRLLNRLRQITEGVA